MGNISLLLDYCVRFYDRQFIMREPLNTNIAYQFECGLSAYINARRLTSEGIPTEFHVYPGLSHGFGLGTGTVAEGWIDDAVRFWEGRER